MPLGRYLAKLGRGTGCSVLGRTALLNPRHHAQGSQDYADAFSAISGHTDWLCEVKDLGTDDPLR